MRRYRFALFLLALPALVLLSACEEQSKLDALILNTQTVLESSAAAWPGIQDRMADEELDWRAEHPGVDHSPWWPEWTAIDTRYRATHNELVKALDLMQKYRDFPDQAPAYQRALVLALAEFADVMGRTMTLIEGWRTAPPEQAVLQRNLELIREVQ